MLPKQTDYKVGMYLRLSRDDERQGESLSIENQRRILTNYVQENGWSIYDTYIDDGISGTTFDRPGVQRLLDDAKSGKINLILCKDDAFTKLMTSIKQRCFAFLDKLGDNKTEKLHSQVVDLSWTI